MLIDLFRLVWTLPLFQATPSTNGGIGKMRKVI
jgi:hypothetical protein